MALSIDPKSFEVILAIEIERHGGSREASTRCTTGYKLAELCVGNLAAIRCAEQPSAGGEAANRLGNEGAIVFFHAPDAAFFIAGEGGRIQHDGIEAASLSGKAVEPVQGIALAEEVLRCIEAVLLHIFSAPGKAGLREIQGGRGSAGQCGADGKSAGVRESVEQAHTGFAEASDAGAVVALVEEYAL